MIHKKVNDFYHAFYITKNQNKFSDMRVHELFSIKRWDSCIVGSETPSNNVCKIWSNRHVFLNAD